MTINTSYIIHEVKCYPSLSGYDNVIGLVRWAIVFSRNGVESFAGIETNLDFSIQDGSKFVPANEISKDLLVSWLIEKEGGQAFIDMLTEIHAKQLDNLEKNANLVDLPLDFVTPHNELIVPLQNA